MYNPFTTLFGRQWYSYTVLLMLGAILSIVWLLYRAPKGKRTATIDVFLAGLVGGVVMGRLVHVALQWQYFVDRVPEIRKIYDEGGLNWHGIIIGALFAMLIMAYIRKVETASLFDSLSMLIPILALIGWWGCGTIGCAYGIPVERMADYPDSVTWAQPDLFGISEPRFSTQRMGSILAIALFILAFVLHRKRWLSGARLWLILFLLTVGMFGIGFLRGDFSVMFYNLRAEHWLDMGLMLFSAILFMRNLIKPRENQM